MNIEDKFTNVPKGKLHFININAEELPSTSTKAKFSYNSKELFVEEVAMEYYRNQGYNAINRYMHIRSNE